MKSYTAEQVEEAVKGSMGFMSKVAKKLGCDNKTAKRYVMKYEKSRDALESETEVIFDAAEGKLYEAILKGEAWAIKFLLSMKGQGRGYMITNYIKQDKSSPLNINLTGSGEMTRDELADAANVEIGGMDGTESETE